MTRFRELLEALSGAQVEYVIIGGLAVITHGHARATLDIDICYARTPQNLTRLATALAPHHPRLRGAPPDLPFVWDERTLRGGLNFTLTTDLGDIDLLGEVAGLGNYGDMALGAIEADLYGTPVKVLSLEDLIRSKAAAGRAKDLIDLEALRLLAATKP